MSLDANPPPLKPLHADEALIEVKLTNFRRWTTDSLIASLHPNQKDCLKVREDGTILDGHHRIKVLRERAKMWIGCLVRQFIEAILRHN